MPMKFPTNIVVTICSLVRILMDDELLLPCFLNEEENKSANLILIKTYLECRNLRRPPSCLLAPSIMCKCSKCYEVSSQQKDCKSFGYKYWFRDEFEVNRPEMDEDSAKIEGS